MNALNTPALHEFLKKRGVESFPEAHTYLVFGDRRCEFTRSEMEAVFTEEILTEKAVKPNELASKPAWHKAYMEQWISDQEGIPYSCDDLLEFT